MNFKKYSTTNFSNSFSKSNDGECFVINKTGYILKESPILNKSAKFSNLPVQTKEIVYNDIKTEDF